MISSIASRILNCSPHQSGIGCGAILAGIGFSFFGFIGFVGILPGIGAVTSSYLIGAGIFCTPIGALLLVLQVKKVSKILSTRSSPTLIARPSPSDTKTNEQSSSSSESSSSSTNISEEKEDKATESIDSALLFTLWFEKARLRSNDETDKFLKDLKSRHQKWEDLNFFGLPEKPKFSGASVSRTVMINGLPATENTFL